MTPSARTFKGSNIFCPRGSNLRRRKGSSSNAFSTGTPYCRYTHEWGTALEGLQRKGFISVENGEIRLTSEGELLIIDLQPYNLGCGLLSASFDPGRVLLCDLKGRQAIKNFEKWLAATIADMMRYVPKENGNAPIPVKSEDFTELS